MEPPEEYTCKEQKVFAAHATELHYIIDVDNLLIYFLSDGVITVDNKQEIRTYPSRTRQAGKLLTSHICNALTVGDTHTFYSMLKIMEEHGDVVTKESAKQMRKELLSTDRQDCISSMRLMRKHVIPRIYAEWETVSSYLGLSAEIKDMIKKQQRGDTKQLCIALIEYWLSTDSGVKPKSWNKLVEVLSEINELRAATQDIKQCLKSEGITLENRRLMDVEKLFLKHYPLLCSHLDMEYIISHCVSRNVITLDHSVKIHAYPTHLEKAESLMDHICYHLQAGYTQSFYILLDIMEKSNYCLTTALAKQLREELSTSNYQETTPALGPVDEADRPLLPPEYNKNKRNICKLFNGLIWTAVTCTAGGLGYYVISGHMNNDGVAAVSGAVCGVTTGALLAVYLARRYGE